MSLHCGHRFTLTLPKVCPKFLCTAKGNLVAKPSKHVVPCTRLQEQDDQINPAWSDCGQAHSLTFRVISGRALCVPLERQP